MIEELKRMFSFLYLIESETKEEYENRVKQRMGEIIQGVNCSLEETINFKALYSCKADLIEVDNKIMSMTLSKEEIALKDGNAKDFEKFVFARFIDHLDEREFIRKKFEFWNEVRNDFYTNATIRFNDEDPLGFEYKKEMQKADNEEKLEEEYGVAIKKEKIVKPIARKGKSIRAANK